MILRNMLVTGAALAWAAAIGWGTPACASSSQPPLRLLTAKGNSFDGFFQQGDYCDYCDGPGCGCFLADSNGAPAA